MAGGHRVVDHRLRVLPHRVKDIAVIPTEFIACVGTPFLLLLLRIFDRGLRVRRRRKEDKIAQAKSPANSSSASSAMQMLVLSTLASSGEKSGLWGRASRMLVHAVHLLARPLNRVETRWP